MSELVTTIGVREGVPGKWAGIGLEVGWQESRTEMIRQVRSMYERRKAEAESFLALSDDALVVHACRGYEILREVTK